MGFMNSLKNFLSPEGDYYEEDDQMDYYEEPVAQSAPETRSRTLFHSKVLEQRKLLRFM